MSVARAKLPGLATVTIALALGCGGARVPAQGADARALTPPKADGGMALADPPKAGGGMAIADPPKAGGGMAIACVVMRAYAPLSSRWAHLGCPPDPEPLRPELQPIAVVWSGKRDGTTRLTYDEAGRIASARNVMYEWRYAYDDAGRLQSVQITGDEGIRVIHEGDAVIYERMSRGKPYRERFVMDRGRLVRIEGGEHDATWALVYEGAALVRARAADEVTRFVWDARGRLLRRERPLRGTVADALEWDDAGHLLSVTPELDGRSPVRYRGDPLD